MQVEVTAAINLIVGNLYNKLPRRRVDALAEELERGILNKFQGHWYPDNPSKGAAFRCVNVSGEKVDPVIVYSVINSGLDVEEVSSYLPKDLMIWVDPGEVSYSIGEKGQVKVLYSERRSSANSSDEAGGNGSQTSGYNSMSNSSSASLSPVNLTDDVTSSFGSMNLSANSNSNAMASNNGWSTASNQMIWPSITSTSNSPWTPVSNAKPALSSLWNMSPGFSGSSNQQTAFPVGAPVRSSNNNNKTMTAAMFAQTKFGSTKLKSQSKRCNRLSPTENFPRNISGNQTLPIGSKGPMSVANQALTDRMQQHLQQQTNNNTLTMADLNGDHFKMAPSSSTNGSSNNMRIDKYNNSNAISMQTMGNPSGGPMGRFSPFTLGSLTGLSSSSLASGTADQDWVDLTDLSVHQTSTGNQLLAT